MKKRIKSVVIRKNEKKNRKSRYQRKVKVEKKLTYIGNEKRKIK